MDTRLRPSRAKALTATTIPANTRENRQSQQAGLGSEGRAGAGPENDGSGRSVQTKDYEREGRDGEVSHHQSMRSDRPDLTSTKVTTTIEEEFLRVRIAMRIDRSGGSA